MINSQIRIPEELWNKIKEISEKEERSINSQIIYILKIYAEEYEKKENN